MDISKICANLDEFMEESSDKDFLFFLENIVQNNRIDLLNKLNDWDNNLIDDCQRDLLILYEENQFSCRYIELDWYEEEEEDTLVNEILQNGSLEIFIWANNNINEIIEICPYLVNLAAKYGRYDIVKWLVENINIECELNDFVKYNYLAAAKWKLSKTKTLTQETIDLAVEHGDREMIKWIYDGTSRRCSTKVINSIISYGKLDTIKFLKYYGTIFTPEMINITRMTKYIEMIKWFSENEKQNCSDEIIKIIEELEVLDNQKKFFEDELKKIENIRIEKLKLLMNE